MDLLNLPLTEIWPLAVLAVILVVVVLRILDTPRTTDLAATLLLACIILGSIALALGCLWGLIWLIKWFWLHS